MNRPIGGQYTLLALEQQAILGAQLNKLLLSQLLLLLAQLLLLLAQLLLLRAEHGDLCQVLLCASSLHVCLNLLQLRAQRLDLNFHFCQSGLDVVHAGRVLRLERRTKCVG